VTGVAVDAQDRVWTANLVDPPIRVFDTEGNFLFAWGAGLFTRPHFLRIGPDGNVWVADYGRHIVRKFTPDGNLLLTLGTPDVPGRDETHLNMPTDMAIAPNGDIFITDGYGNNRIVHLDRYGRFIKSWGQIGVGAGDLSQPHSVAMDSNGLLYVGERNNCRIQVFDQDGKSIAQWRNLINPWGIHITPGDEIIVCGSTPARWTERGNLGNPPHDQIVMKFDATGRALELWAFPLAQPEAWVRGAIDWAHGIGVDSRGNLYIGDVADESPEHRVQKFIRLGADK
jgi:DNA-binding beta-propeller fold protein YncE